MQRLVHILCTSKQRIPKSENKNKEKSLQNEEKKSKLQDYVKTAEESSGKTENLVDEKNFF